MTKANASTTRSRVHGKTLAPTGPSAVTMHSPKAAEPIYALDQYLRKTVAGSRYFEVAALVAAGEFGQQYESSGHEPAALRAGVEQSVIDAIKFNRDLKGVPEKDATIIRLGRAIFRDHKVAPELWARMEQHFGRQGAVEVTTVMADYRDGRLCADGGRSTAATGPEAAPARAPTADAGLTRLSTS